MSTASDACGDLSFLSNETSYEKLSECWIEKRIANSLRICLPLTILPISLFTNCLSFLALRSRRIRGTSTAFFMLALSVLDPLVLITKNLVYFPTFLTPYSICCKILYFLIYVLGYTNVWILVIMTTDKFLAVWFPLKVSYFCTVKRARCICLFLLVMASLISLHHFWTINTLTLPQDRTKHFCYYTTEYNDLIQQIWRYVDFLIWCFLPFILILTFSGLIIYKLRQKRRNSHQNAGQQMNADVKPREVEYESRSSGRKPITVDIKMRSNQKRQVIRSQHRHITLMLLAVAAVFLLLTLPNSVYFVLDLTYGFNKPPTTNDYYQWLRYRRLTILTVVMFQLSDLQHAANFFLYVLTSDKFRHSVGQICWAIVRFFIAILTCSRQQTTRSSYYSQHHHRERSLNGVSVQLSESDESTIIRSSHRLSNKQHEQQRKSHYNILR